MGRLAHSVSIPEPPNEGCRPERGTDIPETMESAAKKRLGDILERGLVTSQLAQLNAAAPA